MYWNETQFDWLKFGWMIMHNITIKELEMKRATLVMWLIGENYGLFMFLVLCIYRKFSKWAEINE